MITQMWGNEVNFELSYVFFLPAHNESTVFFFWVKWLCEICFFLGYGR